MWYYFKFGWCNPFYIYFELMDIAFYDPLKGRIDELANGYTDITCRWPVRNDHPQFGTSFHIPEFNLSCIFYC